MNRALIRRRARRHAQKELVRRRRREAAQTLRSAEGWRFLQKPWVMGPGVPVGLKIQHVTDYSEVTGYDPSKTP